MNILERFKKLSKPVRFSLRVSLFYFVLLLIVHAPFWFSKGVDPSHPLSLLLAGFFIAYRLFFVIVVPCVIVSWLWDRVGRIRGVRKDS